MASFDGQRITARRAISDLRGINRDLPDSVRRELVRSWSPPEWVELVPQVGAPAEPVTLGGRVITLTVWHDGTDIYEVAEPYRPRALSLRREWPAEPPELVFVARPEGETGGARFETIGIIEPGRLFWVKRAALPERSMAGFP